MKHFFEIPHAHLEEFLPLCDGRFGLAHIRDPKYVHRMLNCEILDNGMYENNDEPLSIPALVEAHKLFQPVVIAAPDWMDEMERTLNAVQQLLIILPRTAKIAGTVQGKNIHERVKCFRELQRMRCTIICFPFRTPRTDTLQVLRAKRLLCDHEWYHYFGLQHLGELLIRTRFPGRWSYDTSKPFKGKKLDQVQDVRGLGRLDLDGELTPEERYIAAYNIAYLRRISS